MAVENVYALVTGVRDIEFKSNFKLSLDMKELASDLEYAIKQKLQPSHYFEFKRDPENWLVAECFDAELLVRMIMASEELNCEICPSRKPLSNIFEWMKQYG